MEFLDQHVHQSSQVLVKLVSLRLGDLEKLSDVEEELRFFGISEVLSLVEEEDHLVEKVDTLFFLQGFVVEDVGLLHKSTFVQA